MAKNVSYFVKCVRQSVRHIENKQASSGPARARKNDKRQTNKTLQHKKDVCIITSLLDTLTADQLHPDIHHRTTESLEHQTPTPQTHYNKRPTRQIHYTYIDTHTHTHTHRQSDTLTHNHISQTDTQPTPQTHTQTKTKTLITDTQDHSTLITHTMQN